MKIGDQVDENLAPSEAATPMDTVDLPTRLKAEGKPDNQVSFFFKDIYNDQDYGNPRFLNLLN